MTLQYSGLLQAFQSHYQDFNILLDQEPIGENYIHVTLSNHLPFVSKLGIIQDPPNANDILVTDPSGNSTGKAPTGQLISQIPGSSYVIFKNATGNIISAVLLPEPKAGIYQTQVIGNSTGPFSLDYSTQNFTGNFTNPSIKEAVLNDTISTGGIKKYNSVLLLMVNLLI
jgi:hypothetical protein